MFNTSPFFMIESIGKIFDIVFLCKFTLTNLEILTQFKMICICKFIIGFSL
jgi:hypothetical protein